MTSCRWRKFVFEIFNINIYVHFHIICIRYGRTFVPKLVWWYPIALLADSFTSHQIVLHQIGSTILEGISSSFNVKFVTCTLNWNMVEYNIWSFVVLNRPWWRDDSYSIGVLSAKTRFIKIINTLTSQEQVIEVKHRFSSHCSAHVGICFLRLPIVS